MGKPKTVFRIGSGQALRLPSDDVGLTVSGNHIGTLDHGHVFLVNPAVERHDGDVAAMAGSIVHHHQTAGKVELRFLHPAVARKRADEKGCTIIGIVGGDMPQSFKEGGIIQYGDDGGGQFFMTAKALSI